MLNLFYIKKREVTKACGFTWGEQQDPGEFLTQLVPALEKGQFMKAFVIACTDKMIDCQHVSVLKVKEWNNAH